MNRFSGWAWERGNLLILVGTFSEDMITTGISFSLDDSCMHTMRQYIRLRSRSEGSASTVVLLLLLLLLNAVERCVHTP